MHRFVGFANMDGLRVGVAVDRHGLDAHLATGPDHSQGDLTAVGYQDLSKGSHEPRSGEGPVVRSMRHPRSSDNGRLAEPVTRSASDEGLVANSITAEYYRVSSGDSCPVCSATFPKRRSAGDGCHGGR